MIIGIDHGYYAIKSRNFSFPAGVTAYTHEPYTLKNTLQIGGKYFVCGTGRQPILRDKTVNDNYYILTLAAIAMELRYRAFPAESSVTLAAGLPLARYGRDKKSFTEYLLRNGQPVNFLFEGERYKVKIESVKLFPQGYSAIAIHPELVKDEPSVLLMDIGGWTVDLMRLDNNVPNAATCRSLELGMIRCMDEIQEQVRRDTGLSVTDAQVERILAGKPCSMDEEARKLIQRQGRLYTERLISAAMEAGFDLLNCGEGMRTYHMAVLSSPCSDFRWLYLYTNQKKDVFLDSHVKFFEMVGGCYREVVYDNMKNVVSKFIGKNEKRIFGNGHMQVDIYHYLNTLYKKPGAVRNSVALKSIPRLKAIFDTHYAKRPRRFIELMLQNKSLSIDELIQLFEQKTKRRAEIIALDVVKPLSSVDVAARATVSNYSILVNGGVG